MTALCKALHEAFTRLPQWDWTKRIELIPDSGVYLVYEVGERWGHGGDYQRVVRIGSHTGQGRLRSRIAEHLMLGRGEIRWDASRPKPSDRSIFRKNIGRALLASRKDPYIRVWEYDFIKSDNVARYSGLRDVAKETAIETEITEVMRNAFAFRFLYVPPSESGGLQLEFEKSLIASFARCLSCVPSSRWLGKSSPKKRIATGRLWQEKHLDGEPLNAEDMVVIELLVDRTLKWYETQSF